MKLPSTGEDIVHKYVHGTFLAKHFLQLYIAHQSIAVLTLIEDPEDGLVAVVGGQVTQWQREARR